ncbi:acyl-CoA dehydrogenase family protein [Bordetella pseudohinzii]|uniref:Acyl-CoA dehydrogenase n=1 Tax=Bordetella pseudohinzii TaxID=1331258 RepID=A0A0J6EZW8_9BORD|nr:acyl-CoA dehydrogenase family protein [Bordetella pseudohinzii]ANY14840.1 acyl-CoA dehydrogenase [Bordetella pseudohinzii]KMM25865.1 acyl-CoA dehydrogenase [Bordetella pseudohinzii]KXA75603.1 acyl-CoA dehydrogenase [Bordetella pseudohinzii]KXA77749.1 acyl-CoA dehydrogenase [Bordetella pseudohinzii]CUI93336.1 Acyl-CoA dehydrogenase%2C short-chain specific [Bordetella pseudohinzii]
MHDVSWLDWPFFEPWHGELARELEDWCARELPRIDHHDTDAACRQLVAALGKGGWLRYCVPVGPDGIWGGKLPEIDSRAVCILRETLARHEGLADFALAMQGLGSGAISLMGSPELRARYLPRVARGEAIAAFALSEPEAGSDVAAMQCSARLDGDSYVLDGSKTWISNGGIADFYCVFARTGEAPGARGISAFVVDADTPGLRIAERIDLMAPHPLATLSFEACRIPASQRLGEAGQGFKLAMMTLDIFRASVAAAALGFARRALDEGLARARTRRMFGQTLADLQLTQAALGDMACAIDSAALLTYRAAWTRDVKRERSTREAAMAKMAATESAQQVIDRALQMFGGAGVVSGQPVEKLYREIRALRIYEGATEVQKLIIARELLKN